MPESASIQLTPPAHRHVLSTTGDYDLQTTLSSGQAFRWRLHNNAWEGVVGQHWVRLQPVPAGIAAETATPPGDWDWLRQYLQSDVDFPKILATFPDDRPMQTATQACRGLRLLRQPPWECLASFILSSTKQIVQIQQIVELLCSQFGERVAVPDGAPPACSFPSALRLSQCSEAELRACKMGFRAPYLRETAQRVASGQFDPAALHHLDLPSARQLLLQLPGVGRKIADCVLLFAYGFPTAFPVDVWVMKALRDLYFKRRRAPLKRLQRFSERHFGPFGGYAQQYLFHYFRTQNPKANHSR